MNDFRLINLKSHPELAVAIAEASKASWPEFMRHDGMAEKHWANFIRRYPEHSQALIDAKGAIAASCNAIPLPWDGDTLSLPSGWDAALELGTTAPERKAGESLALCALSVSVHPAFQGQGCGKRLLLAIKEQARSGAFSSLISPMRPSHKQHHPRLPMADYIRRKNPDGRAEDPWLRTHLSLGARVLKVAPESMLIEGTLKEWSDWTKMTFGKSGHYEVPGALSLVKIDLAENRGTYVEPNLWLQYHL